MKQILIMIVVAIFFGCGGEGLKISHSDKGAPYENGKFQNLEPFPDKSFADLLKWRWHSFSHSVSWPEYKEQPFYKVESDRSEKLRVTVVNHATVLIQIHHINILTDPHFTKRASPVSWAGPKRVVNPGVRFEDLPQIDYVLISHNHYDHLDLGSLKLIESKHKPKYLVGLGVGQLLKSEGMKDVVEMDWWDKWSMDSLDIHFVPAQHWSSRSPFDGRETLWGGFYITAMSEGVAVKRIYFAGDTGYGSFFKTIKNRLGAPDVSLIPIGAYEPRWFMKDQHLNPADAVLAHIDLESRTSVGIHFGTFKLTDEGIYEPKNDLEEALQQKGISSQQFIYPEFGRSIPL